MYASKGNDYLSIKVVLLIWKYIKIKIDIVSIKLILFSAEQAKFMADKYHIYLMSSGRINMCGVTTKNIDYVAEAINDAVCNVGKA